MINDYLTDYVGFTAKETKLRDVHKFILENRAEKLGYENKFLPMALVSVVEPKTKEILSIGASVPGDLISDNFGEILAAWHRVPGAGETLLTNILRDVTNSLRTVRIYHQGSNNIGVQTGSLVQIGSGITVPTRGDFAIETVFANGGPEDSQVVTAIGGYSPTLGKMTVAALISPTAGAGTVNESTLFYTFVDSLGALRIFLLSRDAISPAVTFVLGKAVNVEYVWQL